MIIISLPQQINRLRKGRKKGNVDGKRMRKGGEERERGRGPGLSCGQFNEAFKLCFLSRWMCNYYDQSAEWGPHPGACQNWEIKIGGLNNGPYNSLE